MQRKRSLNRVEQHLQQKQTDHENSGYPTGGALPDPALPDYEFRLREPIFSDGLFNYYGDGQGYETYFHGSQDYLPVDYWLDTMGREYILRIPIGIGLLMDENLTAEEAIALHTHATEYDFIATAEDQRDGIAKEGFRVTVYGTGDVVHLLAENPETGENKYAVILRGYAEYDPDNSRLIQYLDD